MTNILYSDLLNDKGLLQPSNLKGTGVNQYPKNKGLTAETTKINLI